MAQGLASNPNPICLIAIGAVVGLLICFFGWASFERAYAFYNFRISFARSLEAELGYRVLPEGKKLSDGEKVLVGRKHIRIPAVARLVASNGGHADS